MYTVIDEALDCFPLVKGLFNSSLFGMSDCFGNLQDGVADVVFPLRHFISKHVGKDISVNGGCFFLGGRVVPKYETGICLVTLSSGFINEVRVVENQCLLFSTFKEMNINSQVIVVFYNENSSLH